MAAGVFQDLKDGISENRGFIVGHQDCESGNRI